MSDYRFNDGPPPLIPIYDEAYTAVNKIIEVRYKFSISGRGMTEGEFLFDCVFIHRKTVIHWKLHHLPHLSGRRINWMKLKARQFQDHHMAQTGLLRVL